MDETADLVGPRKRRLRIAAVVAIAAVAIAVGLLLWQRARARSRAEVRLRAIAAELDRCLAGADGVADDAVYERLLAREVDGHPPALDTCNQAAAAKARDFDLDELSGPNADLGRSLAQPFPASWNPPLETCARISEVRGLVAALDGSAHREPSCALRPSSARPLEFVHDAFAERLDGELYDVLVSDGDRRVLRRFRPDGGVAAELEVSDRFATDRDDVVFVTPTHLSRWRGGARQDGPALPDHFGMVAAWRHTSAGDVGVFWTAGGFRVQTFDDALRPVGASRMVASSHDADLAIGPGGEVVALDDRVACTTDRTIWSIGREGRVQSAPIGQPLAGDATFPADERAISFDCDEAHFYAVSDVGYVVCDHARCAVAQKLPQLLHAAVRAHDGGAEVLALVRLDDTSVLVDVHDPHGDGHPTLDLLDGPFDERPLSFGGRWFVMSSP